MVNAKSVLITHYAKLFLEPFKRHQSRFIICSDILQQWLDGSSFTFEYQDDKVISLHNFEDYLKELLNNSDEIEKEFPSMYSAIATVLKKLDDERKFEKRTPRIPKNFSRK